MPSDAPPSCAEITTSLTCRDSTEVNTFTSSGMMAPARVPQEMIVASFHHCVASPPSAGIMSAEITYVSAIDTREDRKSTRLNSSHLGISYAVFCLKKKSTHGTV